MTEAVHAGRTRRPLVGVLAAMAVSLTGTRVSAIALPWFVLVTTGSATRAGLVAFCEMTPYVLAKTFSGPLVDRTGPRLISWTADLASATAASAIPLLHAFDLLSFPPLLALVALIGAARGPGDLAKEIMIPDAAEAGRTPLERAIALSGVTDRLAVTVGPAAGGALVALFGPLTGLALTAGCFALGALLVTLVLPRDMGRAPRRTPASAADKEPGYWRSFGQGLAFLRGERLLLSVIVMVGITNLLDAGFTAVLVPVWARSLGHGAGAVGLVLSVSGTAAIGGSLIAAALAHRMRRRAVVLGGALCAGAPKFLILAASAPMWAVVAVFAASGFGAGFLNPILGALFFERVPRAMLGRVNAIGDSLAWAGIPFGGLVAGAAAAVAGLVPTLLVAAAVYFLTTGLTGLRPEWREMDRTRGQRAPDHLIGPEPHPDER
ncbi:MFS transporter [Spirillospora sp. NPDC050679]